MKPNNYSDHSVKNTVIAIAIVVMKVDKKIMERKRWKCISLYSKSLIPRLIHFAHLFHSSHCLRNTVSVFTFESLIIVVAIQIKTDYRFCHENKPWEIHKKCEKNHIVASLDHLQLDWFGLDRFMKKYELNRLQKTSILQNGLMCDPGKSVSGLLHDQFEKIIKGRLIVVWS